MVFCALALALPPATFAAGEPTPPPVEKVAIESYEDHFDDSAETAEENLASQVRGASIVGQLQAALGESYAGVWFDNEEGEFVVPLLDQNEIAAVQKALESDDLGDAFRTASAESSWAELLAAHEKIDATLRAEVAAGEVQTSLDPRTNALVVRHAASADKQTALEQIESKLDPLAVRTEVRQSAEPSFYGSLAACQSGGAWHICDRPGRGGVSMGTPNSGCCSQELQTTFCTPGFKATGNVFGNRFIVTAGHCLQGINSWRTWGVDHVPHTIGFSEAWSFPGYDYGSINANGSWWDQAPWPTAILNEGESQEYSIDSEGWAYLGQGVCHVGGWTGKSCGFVSRVDITYSDANTPNLNHMTEFGPVCSHGGDSGGPVYNAGGHTALGIFSASDSVNGSGVECQRKGYFTAITEDVDMLGVKVAPREGGPPSATTAPADNVQGHQATANGAISPNQVQTFYRFEYGPFADYGISIPAPDSDAGHGAGVTGVSATLPNLHAAATYHYRVVAHSQAGTSFGTDTAFTTPPVAPVVTTGAPTDIAIGKATLHGTVNPEGSVSKYSFQYGLTTAYDSQVPAVAAELPSSQEVVLNVADTIPVKGLTTYHYRTVATNVAGTTFGPDMTFTTPDWRPGVSYEPVTGVAAGKATLHGNVNPRGFASQYHLEWGTSSAYGTNVPVPDAAVGSGLTPVAVLHLIKVKGLTTYHYRIVGTNVEGTTLGTDQQFTTPDWKPAVTAAAPTAVRAGRALFPGTVNAKGFPTTYQFEYGPTTSYGTKAPAPPEFVGNAEVPVEANEAVADLGAEGTYHVRLSATNEEGTSYTPDQLFKTSRPSVLCKANEFSCATPNLYSKGTPLSASVTIGPPTVTSSSTIQCLGSSMSGVTTATAGTPLPLEITAWPFASCTTAGLLASVEGRNLPYRAGMQLSAPGVGAITAESGGKGNPGVTTKIPLMSATCSYGTPKMGGLTLTAGAPAVLNVAAALAWEEGTSPTCSKSAPVGVTAKYQLSAPLPAVPTRAPDVVLCSAAANPCPLASRLPAGATISGKLAAGGQVLIAAATGTVKCAGSSLSGVTRNESGGSVGVELLGIGFSSCTGCTSVSAPNLLFLSSIERVEATKAAFVIGPNGKGLHPFFQLGGCSFSMTSAVGAFEIPFTLEGGPSPTLTATEVPLPLAANNRSTGTAPKFSAKYELTAPGPFYPGATS